MLSDGVQLEPRQQFYYARELMYHERYWEAAAVFTAFLEEGKGWVENNIDACRQLAACYRNMGEIKRNYALYCTVWSMTCPALRPVVIWGNIILIKVTGKKPSIGIAKHFPPSAVISAVPLSSRIVTTIFPVSSFASVTINWAKNQPRRTTTSWRPNFIPSQRPAG